MTYFHCPRRQENFNQISSKGRVFNKKSSGIKTIKNNDDKVMITAIMIKAILVTMYKHNNTNDINNDNFLKKLIYQVLLCREHIS